MTDPQITREPQAMTAAEAARVLRVSVDTIYRHGHLLGRKKLGRWCIDPAKVDAVCGDDFGEVPR